MNPTTTFVTAKSQFDNLLDHQIIRNHFEEYLIFMNLASMFFENFSASHQSC